MRNPFPLKKKQQRVEMAHEFLEVYGSMVKNPWTPLLLRTRPGSITRYQKQKENPVSGNIQSRRKPRKFKQTPFSGKVMASVFWDRKGLSNV